jgi:glycerol-3-phosphate cytidylyltransferase-like family protein
VHARLGALLAIAVSRLEAQGIEYCLIGGGCLGMVRHAGQMVPWDDDLDIAVWVDDIPRVTASFEDLPQPIALLPERRLAHPFSRIADQSTGLVGRDGSMWPLGVFIDLVPMVMWRSGRALLANRAFNALRIQVRDGSVRRGCAGAIMDALRATRADALVRPVRERIVHPVLLEQHRECRSRRCGIVSGGLHAEWVGRYPWSTVFPTVKRELLGVRVRSPHDIDDFLVRRYGPDYRQLPAPERRDRHYAYAVHVVVAVSADHLVMHGGKRAPVQAHDERAAAVRRLPMVNEVIVVHGPIDGVGRVKVVGGKIELVTRHRIECVAMGSDWEGEYEFLRAHCDVRYLERTTGISTSMIRGAGG